MYKLFAFLFLMSCLRPHYEKQNIELPDTWRIEADEGSTLCNLRWWEQFQDPFLDELILIALKNNQDLKVAIARVLEYYARLGITNSFLYPTLNGNLEYDRAQISTTVPITASPGISPIDNNFQAFLSLSWELDLWGRIRSASEAALADLLSQTEIRRGVVIKVVSSVANAYIILRQLHLQLEISKKTLESRRASFRLAQDRFNLGETSEIEVKQAETEVEIAIIHVIQFERDIARQENLLSILIGENPRSFEEGYSLKAFVYPFYIPTGLPSDLLIRRPDVMAAEDQLIAANARVTEAKALYFPQISLTGMYGSQSDQLKSFLTSPAETWQYGLTAVQTLFDAGRTGYRVDQAKAIRAEALFSYRQTILNALREVNDGLVSYQKNRALVEEYKKQVQVLNEYLHLAVLRYTEGEIDYLNVLDAERSLFNAELQAVFALSDSFIAIVQLYSALGGGWVNDADVISQNYFFE